MADKQDNKKGLRLTKEQTKILLSPDLNYYKTDDDGSLFITSTTCDKDQTTKTLPPRALTSVIKSICSLLGLTLLFRLTSKAIKRPW